MLARITQLVNDALGTLPGAPSVTPQQVVELIDCGGSPGGAVGRHWVLDPIDGTRGFVGMRQYAVCLGMLQDGKVGGCRGAARGGGWGPGRAGGAVARWGGAAAGCQRRKRHCGRLMEAVRGALC